MILTPTTDANDWKRLLAKPEHWRDGYSAKECALSWERAKGLPKEIARLFPGSPRLLAAIPEYKVALPGGTRASQNDVFALVATDEGLVTCMVEAKRDEVFGPTLAEWGPTSSSGKTARFTAICEMLGLVGAALPQTLRYQLFHRTASAVVTAQRFKTRHAAMIVQSFSPQKQWLGDFENFCNLFGVTPQPDCGYSIDLPSGINLRLGWAQSPLHGSGD